MTEMAFGGGNMLAMAGWLALVMAAFSARLRPILLPWVRFGIPLLLAVAYIVLLAAGADAFQNGGGFSTLDQVRILFLNDEALTAGWLHYLAFDLFVGTWIVENGRQRGVNALLLVPSLVLTFLFGPVGFASYVLLRTLHPHRGAA